MKIAYLLGENVQAHPGLLHKVEGQIAQWQSHGHDVFRIDLFNGTVVAPGGKQLYHQRHNCNERKKSKLKMYRQLTDQYKFAKKCLIEIAPDVTYSRYLFPLPSTFNIGSASRRLVIEINSDDRAEYYQKSIATGLYNATLRSLVLKQAKGLIFVTKELARKAAFSNFTEKRCVIGNGVDTSTFKFSSQPNNSRPQLVFIGTPGQSWQGLDKIWFLATKLPEFDFHIIGPNRDFCLHTWAYIPHNVTVYGYLQTEDAQNVIMNMDVGISTLALHRKGMNEACPLKVRQYLAQGIPVIAASKDPDIEEDVGFQLLLKNTEKNVELELPRIREFIQRVSGNSAIRVLARNYADRVLSTQNKESQRLLFLAQVASL